MADTSLKKEREREEKWLHPTPVRSWRKKLGLNWKARVKF
jgi:hypothetical protein